jgi:hypothetical protein
MIALHDLLSAALEASVANAPVCRDGATVLDRAAFRARVSALVALLQAQDAQRRVISPISPTRTTPC